ncbi:chaperonin 10-like protein [Mycena galopus ATCC 62051]|nr:chaperonin 10-like protein [Mycena galopus ATCC 62051]
MKFRRQRGSTLTQRSLGSYNNLVLEEVPLAPLKATEVLVKTHAVSLQVLYPDNLVPCSDMAGEIIAVGEDVKGWKRGDRVAANFMLDKLHDEQTTEIAATSLGGAVHGVLTEYRAFPAHSLVTIPDHLSYEEGSTLPVAGITAYNALLSGFEPLKAGDTVLVQGAGGVSMFALQFAVASGATVIARSSSDKKLKIVKKLGAKHVSGNTTLQRLIGSVKINGSIDIIGFVAEGFKNMNKLIAANPEVTRPVIDKVFAFEDAKAAFAHLEFQAHVGKAVIKV